MLAYMEAADLIIICHAGSGRVPKALSLSEVILAVRNAIPMAKHQVAFQCAYTLFN